MYHSTDSIIYAKYDAKQLNLSMIEEIISLLKENEQFFSDRASNYFVEI